MQTLAAELAPESESEHQWVDQARRCMALFLLKNQDYGASWRAFRQPSFTDQLFIKARRIRTIQETGENRVGESIEDEWVAIVNYAVAALINLDLPPLTRFESSDVHLDPAELQTLYTRQLRQAFELFRKKNHDYGEAWRDLRATSITDLVLVKLLRIRQIEDADGYTLVSEGVVSNYLDVLNYALFALIRHAQERETDEAP
jgi:hypothetical protein